MLRNTIKLLFAKHNKPKGPTNSKKTQTIQEQQFKKKISKYHPKVKKGLQYKLQAYNMQVASESQLNSQALLDIVKEQRQKLQKLSHNQKSEVQVMYKYLEVANVLGLLGCKLSDSAYWMGFLCDFLILPSIVAMGAGIIGCNLASLVNKQGLNLYKTQIQQVKLTQSPFKYYIQIALTTVHLYLLSLTQYSLSLFSIPPSYIWYGSFLSIISLVANSYYQQRQLPQIKYTGLPSTTTLFAILCFVYMVVVIRYNQQIEFKDGRQSYRQMFMKKKVQAKEEQKINAQINIQDQNQ